MEGQPGFSVQRKEQAGIGVPTKLYFCRVWEANLQLSQAGLQRFCLGFLVRCWLSDVTSIEAYCMIVCVRVFVRGSTRTQPKAKTL